MTNAATDPVPRPSATSCLFDWLANWTSRWNEFWFKPQAPNTLAVMRWLTGCVVLYSHLVWTLGLTNFLSPAAMLPPAYRAQLMSGGSFAWSHFDWSVSPLWLWGSHVFCLIAIALWTIGWQTRWTGILTAAIVVSYANRATGALFGLDQIAVFLCLYLAIGRCGDVYSLDSWLRNRRQNLGAGQGGSLKMATSNRVATRLIQIHLCVVYLFAGIGKLGGATWLNGEAIWGAFASYEYQTFDMTWLSSHMTLVAIITLVSLAWELTYAALVWPKLTRPIVLLLAVLVHAGIGICMGMLTFAFIMIIANMAFVEPEWIRRSCCGVASGPSVEHVE